MQLSFEEKKAIASDLAVSGALVLLKELLTSRSDRPSMPKSSQVENLFEMVLDANSISEIVSFAMYQESRLAKEPGNQALYRYFIRWLNELTPLLSKERTLTNEDKEVLTTFVRDLKRTIKGFEKLDERGQQRVLQGLTRNQQFIRILNDIEKVREEVVEALNRNDVNRLNEKLPRLRELILKAFTQLPG